MSPSRTVLGLAGAALVAITLLAACGQGAGPAAPGTTPASSPSAPGGWQTVPGGAPSSSTPSTSATAPTAPITAAQLPHDTDLTFHEFGDFVAGTTGKGVGESITDCFDLRPDFLGATSAVHRTYTAFRGKGASNEAPALAVGLQFDSEPSARSAFTDFQKLRAGCTAHLAATGNPDGRVGEWHRVDSVATQAGFFEFSYPTDADNGRFESLGAVQHGSRLIVLLMFHNGQDSNWSYQKDDTTGLALHPFIRSLPRVAQRLG